MLITLLKGKLYFNLRKEGTLRKNKLTVLAITFCLIRFGIAHSASVDIPLNVNEIKGKIWSYEEGEEIEEGIEFSLAAEADFLASRKLNHLDGKVKVNIYSGKFIYSFADIVDIYGILGQTNDVEYKAKILNSDVTFNLKDTFIWGAGMRAPIYELKDNYGAESIFKIFVDVKYQQINDMDYKSVTINNTTYHKSDIGGNIKAKWEEYQISLGISKKIGHFVPYSGLMYSHVKASAKAIVSGTTYNLGSDRADKTTGVFVGCSFVPTDQFSIDLQGRFIADEAFTVKATYKF